MGIEIELIHHEALEGCYEIVTTHYPCLEALDKLILVRETIKYSAAKRGLVACFFPKTSEDGLGIIIKKNYYYLLFKYSKIKFI